MARLATARAGVVTRAELLRDGVTPDEIRHRLRVGSLIREHAGVYRVGHRAPSVEAIYLAAVRACAGVLSGPAAAWWFGLIKGKPPPPEVVTRSAHRVPGLKTRRSKSIEATTYRGIPVTTVPRTLVDLAAVLELDDLSRACHEAGVLHGTTPRDVAAVLARRPNTKGAKNLRTILHGDEPVTLSRLERAFFELLCEHGLPLPQTNKPAGGRRVDCRWPERRLTVELDSYRFHHSRHAWEQDRRREREARARGDEFRRYTYGDVFGHPRYVLDDLRELLLQGV